MSLGESTTLSSDWKNETVFNDGDHFFAAFELAILHAKKTIHIETYIFDRDALGLKILALLIDAAKRKVEVKILMDGVGSSSWTNEDANRLRKFGIEIEFFHPLLWQRPAFIFKFPNFRMMNHRDHRKLYLVDGKTAFVGSMNISGRHLRSIAGEHSWRDTSVILTGKPVSALQDSFWVSWSTASERMFHPKQIFKRFFSKLKLPILLKFTLRQRRIYREMIISLIKATQHSIWIATPYFVPDRQVSKAITDAAERGIDVRLLVPKISDFFGVQFAMEGYYRKLILANAKIYEYRPSMMHAKILMIDDFISLGSSNLNHRSFFKDVEMDVILSHPETRKTLRQQFADDFQKSELLTLEKWDARPFYRKVLEKFFYLFRGLL